MSNVLRACALVLLLSACGSDQQKKEIENFITDWCEVVVSGEEAAIRPFFDASVSAPSIFWKQPSGIFLKFSPEYVITKKSIDFYSVTVSYIIRSPFDSLTGTVQLEVGRVQTNWKIQLISESLAKGIKELAIKGLLMEEPTRESLQYDSMLNKIQTIAKGLRQHYDSVVFYTQINSQPLFYVVNGSWRYPYHYDKQYDAGNYTMGVVTADNKIIVPVEYDKVFSPNGTCAGTIEVERGGKRGLYGLTGEQFLPVEYDGIYPYRGSVIAQVKKGEKYGWVDATGKVDFNPDSNTDPDLFKSPLKTKSILGWKFRYPGNIGVLRNVYPEDGEIDNGLIIYPSYLRDLGITGAGNNAVMINIGSDFYMGMEENEIGIEKVESISDKIYSIVSFFMESGADARGYHFVKNDLIVVDQAMDTVSSKRSFISNNPSYNEPCSEETYSIIDSTLLEIRYQRDMYSYKNREDAQYVSQTCFRYYRITTDGKSEALTSIREYPFTQFVKINPEYFQVCNSNYLEMGDDYNDSQPNMVIIKNLSSDELDIMRNEIFAEYGYKFKAEKWKKYFEAKPWYKPRYEDVNELLNEIDKHNVRFILEYQKNKSIKVERDSIQYFAAG